MTHTLELVEDLGRATRNMVVGATAVTTGRLNLDSPDETMDLVNAGDPAAVGYFRHELTHQVAMLLMRLDENVRAVYKEHDLPEAEELGEPDIALADPIYLVVYSERETAALRSLIAAVDQSLAEALSERCGPVRPGVVHVAIIDPSQARRVRSGANGFRPPPSLLVSRED